MLACGRQRAWDGSGAHSEPLQMRADEVSSLVVHRRHRIYLQLEKSVRLIIWDCRQASSSGSDGQLFGPRLIGHHLVEVVRPLVNPFLQQKAQSEQGRG